MASLRRLIAAIPLIVGILSLDLHAQEVITEIVVSGNQRIEPATVANYMTIRAGDAYDVDDVDDSIKNLFDTGFFADVSIRRDGSRLIVEVVENPIINRIAFEGNLRLDSADLEAEIQLRPRTVFTLTKVQADVARITEIYRRVGRFNAIVEPKVIQQEQNRVDLIFEISEGEQTIIREIVFIGNEAFSDGTLREVIVTVESAWYRFLTVDDIYDPDRLAFDQELLRRYYLSEGFADFRIVSAIAELAPNREEFFVTFTLDEGPRYEIGEVSVISEMPAVDPALVEDIVDVESDDWYDASAIADDVVEMTLELGRLGQPFVDVRPHTERDAENAIIDITYVIAQGPEIYVERIDIVGNVRTTDEVIRREFEFAEGDAYNAALVQRTERNIRALDFFASVVIENRQGSRPDSTIIEVAVEEKSTGELSFGVGFSSADDALIGVSIGERNLLGTAQHLRLDLTASGNSQTIDLSYTEPYFLDRELSAGFDVFRVRRDLVSQSSFSREDIGGVLRVGFPLTEHLEQTVSYLVRTSVIEQVPVNASPLVKAETGRSTVSLIGERLDYDLRNDVLRPTSGYLIYQGTDLAGLGGDRAFLRNTGGFSYFYPMDIDWTLNVRADAGAITGLGGKDIRLTDRFFLGGSSFRGFEPSGIGPVDTSTSDALGGNFYWTATGEMEFPIGLPRELGVLGRTFTDWGSLFDIDQTSPSLADDSSPRASAGIGLSYYSPLGPMQFDWAKAFLKEDSDKTELFRFSIGLAF
ncbi:MAG: outer membrane protein assembly factor BamA [bacterium]|nr:outer membrane protein assembly factor BamA [bacterium]